MVWDQASAAMARGEIMIAGRDGHALPPGAAIDREGNPTTDPKAALGLWALVCCLAAYPFGVASAHLDRTSGTGLWLLTGLLSAGGIIGFATAGAMVGRTDLLRGLGHVVAIATAFNLLLSPVVGRGVRWAFASGGRVRTA